MLAATQKKELREALGGEPETVTVLREFLERHLGMGKRRWEPVLAKAR